MSQWEALRNHSSFRNWNAGLFGFVYLDPVGEKLWDKVQEPVQPSWKEFVRTTTGYGGSICCIF